MKYRISVLALTIALNLAVMSGSAFAQTAAADKLEKWRSTLEELKQAQGVVDKRTLDASNFEKQVEVLTAEKKKLEKEIIYYKAKVDNASRSLAAANAAGDREAIEKSDREFKYWQQASDTANTSLLQVDQKLEAALQGLRATITGGIKSDIIVSGEGIQLFVLEDESFNGLYQIREGGYIIMPRVGRVMLAGKDITGVEKAVKEALEASQLRQATVMVERTSNLLGEDAGKVVYLSGEFKTPGALRIPEGAQLTLVKTILRSGGLTDAADLTRVKLLRLENGTSLVEPVDVQAILDGVGTASDLSIRPNDIIVIPSLKPIVYVTGNVLKPQALILNPEEELTSYSAILRCGGFARFAKLRGVYVLRDHGNGEKTRIDINIKEMRKGKIADIVLQGKDIVVVPESFFSF